MSSDDLLRAMALVRAVGGEDSDVTALTIPGAPWSKSRPRFARTGRTYTDPKDRDAEERTAWRLRPSFPTPMPGNVAVACVFYRPNRQRIDADNMLKHVCDAATGIVWIDDSQVTAIAGVVELDAENPRTIVAFARHVSTLGRGVDWTNTCQLCGDTFTIRPSHTAAKYCGKKCSDISRGHVLTTPIPCAHCQQPFARKTTEQKFCSVECSYIARKGQPKNKPLKPFSACTVCGEDLTHRRGGMCRACWRKRAAARAAGVWVDDSQVADLHARKRWTSPAAAMQVPGAVVEVRLLP